MYMPLVYLIVAKLIFNLAYPFISLCDTKSSGEIIWESVLLTTAVVVALTIYTFWASRRGYDFSFLGPFLFSALIILILFILIQVWIFETFQVLLMCKNAIMSHACLALTMFVAISFPILPEHPETCIWFSMDYFMPNL